MGPRKYFVGNAGKLSLVSRRTPAQKGDLLQGDFLVVILDIMQAGGQLDERIFFAVQAALFGVPARPVDELAPVKKREGGLIRRRAELIRPVFGNPHPA